MADSALLTPQVRAAILWILRVVVAGLFLLAGYMKLSGQAMMIGEFDRVGFGQWFRIVTGVLEVVGSLCVLVPAVSVFGAMIVLLVDVGAFFAQAFILHDDIIHTIVIGLVICALIFLQRNQLKAFYGG